MALATAVSLSSDDSPVRDRPTSKHRNEVAMLVVGGLAGGLAGVAANQFQSNSLLAVAGIGVGMAATAAAMLCFDRD